MATSAGSMMRPADVVNHMFICTTNYRDRNNVILLRVNEVGVIRAWRQGTLVCTVEVTSRNPPVTLNVPVDHIQKGALKIDGPLPVDFQGVISTPITTLSAPVPAAPGNDLRKHCAAVLVGISEVINRLPQLKPDQVAALSTTAKIQETSTIINAGVMKCARRLVETLVRKDFTIDDVVRACPRLTKGNHTGGVYLRVYSDFRPPREPEIYIGQTVDMYQRDKSHLSETWNKNGLHHESEHYVVARSAKTWTVVQLCELDDYAGGSSDAGNAIRDICEQLFVIFLDSYHPSTLRYRETYHQKQLAQAIAEDFETKDLAHTYREIGRLALEKTGFALPYIHGREKSFGVSRGLNKCSPMNSDHYEKTQWTLQDIGDRWIFQRSSRTLEAQKFFFQAKDFGSGMTFTVNGSTLANADSEPLLGDSFVVACEFMKPDKGQHPVPHFCLPNIGPWNNWHYVNKIAFKICWKHKTDGRWRVKYLQQQNLPNPIENSPEGSNRSYALGVALYAKFTRNVWENKPDFVPNFGKADIIATRVDHFNQRIETKRVSEPLCTLSRIGFSPEVARTKMRQAGYENVDGPWASLDWKWLSEKKYFANGKLPAKPWLNKRRGICDRCHLLQRRTRRWKCERVGESNHCMSCRLQGLPCSWTKVPKLYGVEHEDVSNDSSLMPTGAVYLKSAADLVMLPIVKEAIKAQFINDPGFLILDKK